MDTDKHDDSDGASAPSEQPIGVFLASRRAKIIASVVGTVTVLALAAAVVTVAAGQS